MNERAFRLIQGSWLLAGLYFNEPLAIQGLLLLLAFEGATNWRIPTLVSNLRHGGAACGYRHGGAPARFEAERALRLVMLTLLVLGLYLLPQLLWWLPWLIGIALVSASLSGICLMVTVLRLAGLP